MKELYALVILRIIHLSFKTTGGRNPDMCSLENKFGNKIYIQIIDDYIKISVYKVTKRCYTVNITDKDQIETVVEDIKEKIKTDDYGKCN